MEKSVAPSESLKTGFVTAEETASLAGVFELALDDIKQVAGGIPAVCACGCCVPVPPRGHPPVLKM
jgi:hypothetical protein